MSDTPETETFIIRFRPLDRETLVTMTDAYARGGQSPEGAYSVLLSAALVAAAILNLRPEEVAEQVATCYPKAILAVHERTDVFGRPEKEAPPAAN